MVKILCPLAMGAKKAPDHPAFIADTHTWSYRELDSAVHSCENFLRESGIKEGQRISFLAKAHPKTIVLLFALFRLGAIACPLSFRIPEEQLSRHFSDLSVAHILEPEIIPLDLSHPSEEPLIDLEATATLLLTSGSSGEPKAACLSFGNHHYNALGAISALQLGPTSRWLLSLPLFHVSGLGILFRCFQSGATVVLSELPLQQSLLKFQITHLSQVPTQLYRMLREDDLEFAKSLKCLVLGGASIPQELLNKAHNRGLPVFTTYGMTEMGSMITLSQGKPNEHAGRALPHRELKVERDGEIWVRGKTLFQGFWDILRTEKALTQNAPGGWYPTKDLGRLTEVGNLAVIGRKDRQFISGGENIQPEEIEKALCQVPGILQASVLPIDDPEFGKRPVAFISDETNAHTLQSIREALQSTLASFKHPIALFGYPPETGLKPSLSALRKHLESVLKNRG